MYKIEVILPEDFLKDDFYRFEVESKGYLHGIKIVIEEKGSYTFSAYQIERIKQDCEETGYFFEPNLIILNKFDKYTIVEKLQIVLTNLPLEYFVKD